MDNIQFWIYIIIALIYVIGRAMKKGQQPPAADRSEEGEMEETRSGERPARPLTFEELLREITEGKATTQRPVTRPQPKPQPAFVDYDDDLKDEEEDLEDVDYDYTSRDSVYDVYEKAKADAFSAKPSLEETLMNEKKDIEYGRFKEFSVGRKSTLLDEYVAELRRPSGFKKAIVMSEILNRRF